MQYLDSQLCEICMFFAFSTNLSTLVSEFLSCSILSSAFGIVSCNDFCSEIYCSAKDIVLIKAFEQGSEFKVTLVSYINFFLQSSNFFSCFGSILFINDLCKQGPSCLAKWVTLFRSSKITFSS